MTGAVFYNGARRLRLTWGLGLMLALAGCATAPAMLPLAAGDGQERPAFIGFTVSGRFSAKSGKEQVSGQFRYSQTSSQRSLSVFSPLGTPLAEITADASGAVLAAANGATQRADSIAALLRGLIELPVTDAQFGAWLQGRPSALRGAEAPAPERDALGRLARFHEAGWDIALSDRFAANDVNGNVADAPRRMRWSFADAFDTEVRWIIDEWKSP